MIRLASAQSQSLSPQPHDFHCPDTDQRCKVEALQHRDRRKVVSLRKADPSRANMAFLQPVVGAAMQSCVWAIPHLKCHIRATPRGVVMLIVLQLDDVPEEKQKPLHVSSPCVWCRKAGDKVIGVREIMAHCVDAPCYGDPNDCEIYLAGECDGEQDSETCRGLYMPHHVCAQCAMENSDVELFSEAICDMVNAELFVTLPDIPAGHEVVVHISTRPRQEG